MLDTGPSPQHALPAAAGKAWWQVQLLGCVQAHGLHQQVEHFPTRAVAALLARLALAPARQHPREELVELLWPGAEPSAGRNRLRQALSVLKALLEPPAQEGRQVILANRQALWVAPGALSCDVLAFEALARAGDAASALALYAGDLMPGHYEDWVQEERLRLAGIAAALREQLGQQQPGSAAAPEGPPAQAAAAAQRATLAEPAALPRYLTRLYGIETAAAQLRASVLAQRLVTHIGPGGSGKTRLAVAVASSLQADPAATRAGGGLPFAAVRFVSLVACRDERTMLEHIARCLGLPGAQSAEELLPALQGRPMLLVLDNLEQLVGPAMQRLAELLAAAPELHLLATSRTRLGLDGETLCAAEPLPLPPAPLQAPDLQALAANPAVALFLDRARASRADFHLSPHNAAAVADLVRELGGLPLAVELAASRVRSFPPAQLLALLRQQPGSAQLALLQRRGPRAAHDSRHASMSAVLDWSWQLLNPAERRLLQALALWPGDAGLATLAQGAGLPEAEAAAGLDELLLHGLLRSSGEQAMRFAMAEPVREYVLQGLGDAAALQQRLRTWLLQWAEQLPPLASPRQVAPELPAVYELLAHAAQLGPAALRLAVCLRGHWERDPLPLRLQQALEDLVQALATQDGKGPAAGSALASLLSQSFEMLAYLRFGAGFAERAREHAEAALQHAGAEPALRARALVRRAWIEVAAGRAGDRAGPQHQQARAWLEQALQLGRQCGDREVQARALQQLGVMAGHLHAEASGADPAAAEALFASSQALWEALGHHAHANARLRNRAQCWRVMGRADEAMQAYQRCLQAAVAEDDWVGQIDCHISMAELLAQQRRWQQALHSNRQALALCWQRWFRHGLAYALWNPALALAHLRQPQAALQLMAFAAVFWGSQFGPLVAADRHHLRRVRRLATVQLGRERAQRLWAQGEALDVASAVALVLQDSR